ncbi:hypothetical protein C8R47DRAFT_1229410 [Mycena vitilis]|nr:hypothetical protein C8R47DRAFT_1229410 [Mycena vitilis]
MGFIHRAWPEIAGWVREISGKSSIRLGDKPTPFQANVATPIHKRAKRDKTSTKAWRPVENLKHILAKPLERLIADRFPTTRNPCHSISTLPNTVAARDTAQFWPWTAIFTVAIGVFISLTYGFVDDTNFSTSSKSVVVNQAGEIAVKWARDDNAIFEKEQTELIHHALGNHDLSGFKVIFDGEVISPSNSVKWIGVVMDAKLKGAEHIRCRAASAARALNASLALTHAMWGMKVIMKPQMVRDLVLCTVLPRADYGVSCFFLLPPAAL